MPNPPSGPEKCVLPALHTSQRARRTLSYPLAVIDHHFFWHNSGPHPDWHDRFSYSKELPVRNDG
jgi:hypothetical protein